jgi:hypothetical protein
MGRFPDMAHPPLFSMAKTMLARASAGRIGSEVWVYFVGLGDPAHGVDHPWRAAPARGKRGARGPKTRLPADDQNQLASVEAAPNCCCRPMPAFLFDATDLLVYGLPAGLLVIALGRSLKSGPKAALVYAAVLAAWLGHWTVQKYQPPGLQASLRIEAPDQLPAVPQVTQVNGQNVLHLQAPAGLEWTLRGDERRLDFSYGLVPGAYEQGNTDGCGFTVSLHREGVSRTIFYRLVQPRERPEDRGIQQARLLLPPVAAGEVLRVAIDVGPNGDNGWDWALLCRVGFTRSRTYVPSLALE